MALNDLSKEAFEVLVEAGQTYNLQQVNKLRPGVHVDKGSLVTFHIDHRPHRGAVHIRKSSFVDLCLAIAQNATCVARNYA